MITRLFAILLLSALTLGAAPVATAQQNPNGNPPTGGNTGSEDDKIPKVVRRNVALTATGRIEYVAIGPRRQSALAARLLTDAGAQLLRRRDYPNLDRRALILDLQRLPLGQARRILAQGAPQTVIDIHTLYRYAKGAPRLYAARLVDSADSPGCTLPANLRLGMIDGPVETRHPALRGARVVIHSALAGNEPAPDQDHGTAVAALLVGRDATGALAGYASGAQLYAVSAFTREGRSEAADVERLGAALDWLISKRVRVINMSFAGPVNRALDNLLVTAAGRGAILIAAVGNDGKAKTVYPAAADPVIAVTAIDARMRRYRSANTGPYIEFAAPGVDLYVATRTGGNYASGTSYAAPIVAGIAARLAARGVRSAAAMRARLKAQSVDLGQSGRDSAFGWGMVKSGGC